MHAGKFEMLRSDPQMLDLLHGPGEFLHLLWTWHLAFRWAFGVHASELLHEFLLLADKAFGLVFAPFFHQLSCVFLELDNP
jgi:hypothetical protein